MSGTGQPTYTDLLHAANRAWIEAYNHSGSHSDKMRAALDAVLARPDLIAVALGYQVDRQYSISERDGVLRARDVWTTPVWEVPDEDPDAEAVFWADHYDQATDDAEREARA